MDQSIVCGRFVNDVDELYKVDKNQVLGRGKYGTVYRGHCQKTGQQCAIKVIKKIRQDRAEVRRECNIFHKIHQNPHSNIVQLIDWFETRREYYIVTELLEGGELFYFLQEREYLCEADAVAYVRQLLLALDHLHKQQICHLDLKPENIVLAGQGSSTIKLVDFGAARDLSLEKKGGTLTLVGTPEFVAPEVIAYNPITGAADLWSLGVVTYVILSGLSPFLGDSDMETLANVTRSDYYFPEDDFPPVSQDAKDFINALLVRNPRKRLSAEQALQHPWIQPGNVRLSQLFISTDKLKNFNGRQKILAAFNVVRFAIKLRSFSRLHQLKHVEWDDNEVRPPMEPTESDDDLMSSEVDTIRSSEDLQLASTLSLESFLNCVSAGEEENEETKITEKERREEEGGEVEHMHQAIGSLARLALEALEGSETNHTANSQVDTDVSCLRDNAVASPVCGSVETHTTNCCTASEYHSVCSPSSNGDILSSSAHPLEDVSRSGDQVSQLSSNSELTLRFSDLVHLMHACRCNGDVSHGYEHDATVLTGSDKAEGSHLLALNSDQEVEAVSERVQYPSSCEVATSGGVAARTDGFEEVRHWEEDLEHEKVTAAHSTQKQVLVEGQTPEGGIEACESDGTEDASAMPIMDAWVVWDTSKSMRVNNCSKVLPPSTGHQVNALELESSGQTDSSLSPAASPSALWSNECD